MKVRLIKQCWKANPDFNPKFPPDEDNPHDIPLPIGTEIEDPMCYLLCLPEHMGDIRAEPIDDEAKRWVAYENKRMATMSKQDAVAVLNEEIAVAQELSGTASE